MNFWGMDLIVTQREKYKLISYVWPNIVKKNKQQSYAFLIWWTSFSWKSLKASLTSLSTKCLKVRKAPETSTGFFQFTSYPWKMLGNSFSNLVTRCPGHDFDQWFVAIFRSDSWKGLELFSRLLNNDHLFY